MVDKEVKSTINPLEQFILLAKSARGAAIVQLINQVLETPGIYVFGELLQMPNIQELEDGDNSQYWKLLNIFAYGKYSDYKANKDVLPELSAGQTVKLQHLTIVSLAAASKYIPYSVLLRELEISNVRQLEDLIIEAIYADIIHGKLDQKNSQLEVEYSIGRDIKPENVNSIVSVLQEWCDSCETVLHGIERQIQRSNSHRDKKKKQKTQFESELENLKIAIKASTSQDIEDDSSASSAAAYSTIPLKKLTTTTKNKGPKATSKFFTSKR